MTINGLPRQEVPKQPGPDDLCACGSGLEFKRCHGDEALRQDCKFVASMYIMLRVLHRKLWAGLISDNVHTMRVSEIYTALFDKIYYDEPADMVQKEEGIDDADRYYMCE